MSSGRESFSGQPEQRGFGNSMSEGLPFWETHDYVSDGRFDEYTGRGGFGRGTFQDRGDRGFGGSGRFNITEESSGGGKGALKKFGQSAGAFSKYSGFSGDDEFGDGRRFHRDGVSSSDGYGRTGERNAESGGNGFDHSKGLNPHHSSSAQFRRRFNSETLYSDRLASLSSGYPGGRDSEDTWARATLVPVDRPFEEMYADDEHNAKYEVGDLDQEVVVTGRLPKVDLLRRIRSWDNAGFAPLLVQNIERCMYSVPRRIQAAVIPLAMEGYDLLGHAETGSGKTLAFMLPIIDHIMKRPRPDNCLCAPIALVVAPTRELVSQLYNQTKKMARETNVSVAQCYGRTEVLSCLENIRKGCDILVATPGRLIDFVENDRVSLRNIKFFVLDEADKMLERNEFLPNIVSLTSANEFPPREERQTMLFSATFDCTVQKFAQVYLKDDYLFVSNGKLACANPRIDQRFIQVSQRDKVTILLELLKREEEESGNVSRTMVFVTRKLDTDTLAMHLSSNGIRALSIHGSRNQFQREEALKDFRKGNTRVLLATDVCARGIDVSNLEHVINYDLPTKVVTYVHRIGRTGRMHHGKATSFVDPIKRGDQSLAVNIVKIVREAEQQAPQFLLDLAEGRGGMSRTTTEFGLGSGGGYKYGGGFKKRDDPYAKGFGASSSDAQVSSMSSTVVSAVASGIATDIPIKSGVSPWI